MPANLQGANGALQAVGVDVEIAAALGEADLVHSHTWYANTAGLLASLVHGAPHVVTAHSLEPRRPWKADQLGGGYRLSSWVERTAYLAADAVIAVSHGMRADVLDAYPDLDPARVHVVGNGVDAEAYRPIDDADVVRGLGVDPDRPYALFVGRITRQKGVMHLLAAAEQLPPEVGLVLCAGAPDTPAERQQVADAVAELQTRRSGVVWIEAMLPREQLVPLITGPPCSSSPRSTSRWASSTSRPPPAAPPSSPAPSAASPRSSTTAAPGCWCPTTRPTPPRSSAGSPRGSPSCCARPGPRRGHGRGRPGAGAGGVRLAGDRAADRRGLLSRPRRPPLSSAHWYLPPAGLCAGDATAAKSGGIPALSRNCDGPP